MRLITYALLTVLIFASYADARVENPVLFIGEAVAGATVGAPLSSDTNGNLLSGITNTEVTFTSAITTTSTASPATTVMTGVTTTPAAGTYLVVFSSWFTQSTGNATVTICIAIAGTCSTASTRTTLPFTGAVGGANGGVIGGTNAIVTVNGSQAIAIVWRVSSGTGTATDGNMDIVRLQ